MGRAEFRQIQGQQVNLCVKVYGLDLPLCDNLMKKVLSYTN